MIDYLDFDDNGLKEVRCMICNVPVKVRREVNGKIILRTLSHFRRIPLALEENGKPHSVMNILGCATCADKPINYDDVLSTTRFGWNKEQKHTKKPKKERDEYFDRYRNITVNHRLDKSDKRKVK